MNDLFSRNIGTLTVDQQLKISATKVGIAGCGLGSEVARQIVRFGFDVGALADPDVVEIHNLNRQNYHQYHVGKKKVHSLLDSLHLVNPGLNPRLFEEGITRENYADFVNSSDIIVDAIDPDAIHLSLAVTREAHRQGKPVVTALDFGFGARLFVFPADGINIMDFLGFPHHITDEAILAKPVMELMAAYMEGEIPEYVFRVLEALGKGELTYYPQNVLAVSTAGTMITAACKRLALDEPIIAAPRYLHIDYDWMLAGNKLS